ncbi:MAG: transcriptional regulator [Chloroflexi bacterium]|nr:transcriptional regulator [Chloroflexota bacterium]
MGNPSLIRTSEEAKANRPQWLRTRLDKSDRLGKRDRTARLLKVEHLLYQNPKGLMIEEIARMCDVSKRTAYRDLKALEYELGVPIWEEGSKRGITEGYILPPVHFSLPEALNVFLAARLMLNYSHRYDPNINATFIKLNSVLPPALGQQVRQTLDWMQKLPKDEKHLRVLATVAEAWVSQRRLRIAYRSLPSEKATERVIEPYYIEPAAPGHASYVVGHCHLKNAVRTFKIERIESAQLTSEAYTIPPDFDANAFFGSSWGIVVEGEVKTVRLKIRDPEIMRIMGETVWHPSQVLEKQKDGSMIMTLRVTDTYELLSWILSWGQKMEVLEPAELRKEVLQTARAMLRVYQKK